MEKNGEKPGEIAIFLGKRWKNHRHRVIDLTCLVILLGVWLMNAATIKHHGLKAKIPGVQKSKGN